MRRVFIEGQMAGNINEKSCTELDRYFALMASPRWGLRVNYSECVGLDDDEIDWYSFRIEGEEDISYETVVDMLERMETAGIRIEVAFTQSRDDDKHGKGWDMLRGQEE